MPTLKTFYKYIFYFRKIKYFFKDKFTPKKSNQILHQVGIEMGNIHQSFRMEKIKLCKLSPK